MTFVADFTPEQLQNASAGRRYGQRKREAQQEAAVSNPLEEAIEKYGVSVETAIDRYQGEITGLRQQLAQAEAQNARHLAHIGQLAAQKQKAEAEIARLKKFKIAEHELSDAYIRLRVKLKDFGAMDTVYGGFDRFQRTEEAVDKALGQLSALTTALSALVEQWRKDAAPHLGATGDESEIAYATAECADEVTALLNSLK